MSAIRDALESAKELFGLGMAVGKVPKRTRRPPTTDTLHELSIRQQKISLALIHLTSIEAVTDAAKAYKAASDALCNTEPNSPQCEELEQQLMVAESNLLIAIEQLELVEATDYSPKGTWDYAGPSQLNKDSYYE